jgi:hypothetical protein
MKARIVLAPQDPSDQIKAGNPALALTLWSLSLFGGCQEQAFRNFIFLKYQGQQSFNLLAKNITPKQCQNMKHSFLTSTIC